MLDGSFIGRLSVLIYLFLGCRERSLGIRGWGVFIWWGGERVSECRVLCSIGGSGKIIPLKLLTIASMFWYFQRVKSFKNTPLNFSSPKIHEINSYMFFISLFSSNITQEISAYKLNQIYFSSLKQIFTCDSYFLAC